jgi:hypothetical protein
LDRGSTAHTVGLDTVAGLDLVVFDDTVGRSRAKGDDLVDVALAAAHRGVYCCWDPLLF